MSSKEKHPKDGDDEKGLSSSMSSSVSSREDVRSSGDEKDRKRSRKRDSSHHRKRKKESLKSDRKSRKRHRHDDDSSVSSASSSSSSASSSSRSVDDDSVDHKEKKRKSSHDHKKKKKKRSKEKRKKEKKSKKKKKKRSKDKGDIDEGPVFGKYGIIKLSDMPTKQRTFEMWLEQVKGLPAFNGPKWELQNYFKEYAEDYNTATLPHIKYYDYDKWEMDEYNKNMAKAEASSSTEAAFQREQQAVARNKQTEGFNLVKTMMNKEKIEEMKRQKQLQSEMAHAFKTGDHQRYQQLKNRLEREK
jgi:hypothetical protein